MVLRTALGQEVPADLYTLPRIWKQVGLLDGPANVHSDTQLLLCVCKCVCVCVCARALTSMKQKWNRACLW